MHRRALATLGLVAACAQSGSPEVGHDLDIDPALIGDGKEDNTVCLPYPGGPLAGDDLLVLVDKQPDQQLAEGWAPTDLVAIDSSYMMPGRTGELRLGAYQALQELVAAARDEDDLDLVVRSAYRSFVTQCWTFDFKVQEHGLEHAKRFSAEPGRSQHQLGTTVDFTSEDLSYALSQSMGSSAEGQWLAANAHRFGFALAYPEGFEEMTGYAFEPWHYRYIGRDAAAELEASGEILETYLALCADGASGLRCPLEDMPEPEINAGWIGGACQEDSDCSDLGPGAHCLGPDDGYSDGHCTRPCNLTCPDRPGPNAISACLATDEGGLCHSRCDFELFETGCRPGYQCLEAARPQGDTASACLPAP